VISQGVAVASRHIDNDPLVQRAKSKSAAPSPAADLLVRATSEPDALKVFFFGFFVYSASGWGSGARRAL
jgi:hypothetical protein